MADAKKSQSEVSRSGGCVMECSPQRSLVPKLVATPLPYGAEQPAAFKFPIPEKRERNVALRRSVSSPPDFLPSPNRLEDKRPSSLIGSCSTRPPPSSSPTFVGLRQAA